MSRHCEDCGKIFTHRQSLFKHKKKCKSNGSSVHVPITVPKKLKSTDELSAKHATLHKFIETVDDETSGDTSEDDKSDDTVADLIDQCEDEEELYDEVLWELFCVKCLKFDWSIYECMQKHLDLYYNKEKDDPYQEIMEDVEREESQGTCFVDALDDAIKKHEDLIEESAVEYRDKTLYWRNEPPNVWRYLAIPCKYRCSLQSRADCNCENNSCSLLRRFRTLAMTLHAMEIDDLIQDIIEAVEKRIDEISVEGAIEREIKVREGPIIAKFRDAKERLQKKGYDEENLWKIFEKKVVS